MQPQTSSPSGRPSKFSLKRTITYILIVLLYIVAALSILEVIYMLYLDIIRPPVFFLEVADILDILGQFLLVLVVLELLETVKAYLDEDIVHVEVVLEAAMIAVARKIIILNSKETTPLTIFGIGFLLVAVAASYFAVKYFLIVGKKYPANSHGTNRNES